MQIKDFLENVVNQINYKPIRNQISEELKQHIDEQKEEFVLQGIDNNKSEKMSIEQMGNPEEIGKKLNKIHRPKLDWTLLILICSCLCFSFLIAITRINYYPSPIKKTSIYTAIGIFLSIGVYFFDYTKLKKHSKWIFGIASLVLLYTLFCGQSVNGRKVFLFNISSATIAVPLYIISFGGFLENLDYSKKLNIEINKKFKFDIYINIIKIAFLSCLALFLLSVTSYFSSAIICGLAFLAISSYKIFIKTNKIKNVLILFGTIGIILALLFIIFVNNRGFSFQRIITSFYPESDPAGGGWIGMQQNIIIENANLFGEASNMSDSIDLFDEGTEFAFISILAHYGWIVAISMVCIIVLLSIKLISNSIKITDIYGKLLIIGIASNFIFQSLFNILMNLNLGLKSSFSLPLISYGGTSFVINLLCLAIVLSIYRRKDILLNEDK